MLKYQPGKEYVMKVNAILVIKIQETYAQTYLLQWKCEGSEYLETDKEKNVGRTPLSSDIQQIKNFVEDVPPFPESRAARGSVSAAYRLSLTKCLRSQQ